MKIYKVYQYNILYAHGFCNPIYYLRFTISFLYFIYYVIMHLYSMNNVYQILFIDN